MTFKEPPAVVALNAIARREPEQLELPLVEPIGIARDLRDAHRIMRDYAEQQDVSRERLDELAGLASGHSGHLLANPPTKHFGMTSFWLMLGALELAVAFIRDPKARKRLAKQPKRWPTDERRLPPDKQWRNARSAGIIAETLQRRAENGGHKRFALMTPEQISAHQSHAAKSRWRAHRKQIKELYTLLGPKKFFNAQRRKSKKRVKSACG